MSADRPERPSDEAIGRARFATDVALREPDTVKPAVLNLARCFRWADSERARLESETAETEEQAAEREDRLARAIVVALGEARDSAKPDLSFMGQYQVVRAALAKARGDEGG